MPRTSYDIESMRAAGSLYAAVADRADELAGQLSGLGLSPAWFGTTPGAGAVGTAVLDLRDSHRTAARALGVIGHDRVDRMRRTVVLATDLVAATTSAASDVHC